MDKFKIKTNTGSGYVRAVIAYQNYIKKFEGCGATLVGNYEGKDVKTLISWQGILFEITPKNFIMQTVKRYNDLKLACSKNNDELIKITRKDNRVIYVEIRTFDGGTIEISSNNYGQFIRSRNKFLNKIKEDNCSYLPPYVGSNENIGIDYGCGHGYEITKPVNFLNNKAVGCEMCARKYGGKNGNKTKLKKNGSLAENNPELICLWSDKNKLSPYDIGSKSQKVIYWKCEKGHEDYPQTPKAKIQQNQGCPKCSMSKGEKIIGQYLNELNIEFNTQYRLKNRGWRYDLYIPKYNLIIEVHGLQHYEENDFFDNRTLEEEQENDRLKEEYARSNGYNYMIVDYREHNPELTLKRFREQFEKYYSLKRSS